LWLAGCVSIYFNFFFFNFKIKKKEIISEAEEVIKSNKETEQLIREKKMQKEKLEREERRKILEEWKVIFKLAFCFDV
jgi:hypothetical protein